jgi:type IV pilus assembly protein PilA
VVIAVVVLVVLMAIGGDPYVIEIPFRLLFGWYGFIQMNLEAMQPNWVLIGEALICIVVLGVGGHYFCRWLWGHMAGSAVAWQPRWTVAGLAGVLLLFVTGIAIIGITHQTAWLFTSKALLWDSFTTRARISEALLVGSAARTAIAEYYAKNGRPPDSAAEAGIDPGEISSKTVKSMQVERGGVVRIMLDDTLVEDGILTLTPQPKDGVLQWKCSSNLDRRQLPSICRD